MFDAESLYALIPFKKHGILTQTTHSPPKCRGDTLPLCPGKNKITRLFDISLLEALPRK